MSFTSTGRVQSSLNSWVERKNFLQCLTLLLGRPTMELWLRVFSGRNSKNCHHLVRNGFNNFVTSKILLWQEQTTSNRHWMSQNDKIIIYSFPNVETEIRDEANLRFVFDTDVNNLINILETRGITKWNFYSLTSSSTSLFQPYSVVQI